ncbi:MULTISPECIES: DNA repair protein RecO [Pseudoalteromonas]|uniref:DNA repair protein RecO n=1 Tax=Pseudoalteromonas piscicida TaxID=43662 RepID=A0AAD0RJB3_PSEO7|nr:MULTISPECIES: DNA repair protein RecO [Pseudoalteromonas]ASD66527.1 DNA repair protein RecO [Pseudoalteromonas piscicida]AXQ97451.1 DNA repair protein RecO [Pseudoalteromonas piscicida]AXR02758.1 DNA repair protein RecO [Pseudoalteromonas piscicida]
MDSDFRQAYLLHRRPYSDSQVLLDVLVEGVGQLKMLARVKGKQSLKHNAQLRPFSLLLLQYAGRYDFKYVNRFEPTDNQIQLVGRQLYCGLYLNELTQRVVPTNEPLEQIFALYQLHLMRLAQDEDVEPILRSFELQLLGELGFGVELEFDAEGNPVRPKAAYKYVSEYGFIAVGREPDTIPGSMLLAIANQDFQDLAVRRAAKLLTRKLMAPLVGKQGLKSRELFISKK